MRDLIIGIDLGGTSIKLAIIKDTGEIFEKWTIATNKEDAGSQIVPDIIQAIKQKLTENNLDYSRIIGIGMGSPGAVNREKGSVAGAYNLNWKQEQLIQIAFEEAFGLPFYLDNDANVAALGEKWQGSGENLENVVFITLGTGVGGGIIVNNQLVVGRHGCAGEIGHLYVTDNPKFLCTCGNAGCLEAVASATGMIHLTKELAQQGQETSLLKDKILADQEISVKEIFDAARAGEVFAEKVIQEFTRYIGIACSHLTNILNPDRIIIGGGISAAGDFLLQGIQETYLKYVFPKARDQKVLTLAKLGNDAGILGAAYLVMMNQKG